MEFYIVEFSNRQPLMHDCWHFYNSRNVMEHKNRRLLIIISLVLTTGFLGTSVTSYLVSSASLSAHITERELPLTGDNIYSEIQRDLLRPIFIASLMASDTFLRDWVIQGEKGTDKISRYLGEIKTRYNTFSSFFVSEETKKYYYSKGVLKTVNKETARDHWYFRIENMNSDFEINVDADMANKDAMTIFINHKVFDYEGNYIGATGVGLAIHAVNRLINTYQDRYQRNIFFSDKQGRVMLHGSHFPATIKNVFDIEGVSKHKHDILKGNTNSFQYKENRQTVYVNNRYIPEFGWYLFVKQTGDKGLQKIERTLIVNLVVSLMIIVLILIGVNLIVSSYQNRLTKMASTDKLTGLYNRRAFDIMLNQTLKLVLRGKSTFSIILIDIDHFKNINDTYSHLAGDTVIRSVVKTIEQTIRTSDVLCRWGGEEFLILLQECELEDAWVTAEKVRMAVGTDQTPYNDQNITVTISLGITQHTQGDTMESVLSRADEALYSAKNQGRNMCKKA